MTKMNNITLEEVKMKEIILQRAITNAIQEFQYSTGISIKSIDINFITCEVVGKQQTFLASIKTTLAI